MKRRLKIYRWIYIEKNLISDEKFRGKEGTLVLFIIQLVAENQNNQGGASSGDKKSHNSEKTLKLNLLSSLVTTKTLTQRRSGASQHMTKTSIILICVYILF